MDFKTYKWCAVPQCTNTIIKTPKKLFIIVPKAAKDRKKWLQNARRDPASISKISSIYFCEDHFDLPNDMENYMEYHIMGSVRRIAMKPGTFPTKFHCQLDRRKKQSSSTRRPLAMKRERRALVQKAQFEHEHAVATQQALHIALPGNASSTIAKRCDSVVVPSTVEAQIETGQIQVKRESEEYHVGTDVAVEWIKREPSVHETDELCIKEELEIEPMVLQPRHPIDMPKNGTASAMKWIKHEPSVHETDELCIKEELEIEPMVLQPHHPVGMSKDGTAAAREWIKREPNVHETNELYIKEELEIEPMVLPPVGMPKVKLEPKSP